MKGHVINFYDDVTRQTGAAKPANQKAKLGQQSVMKEMKFFLAVVHIPCLSFGVCCHAGGHCYRRNLFERGKMIVTRDSYLTIEMQF